VLSSFLERAVSTASAETVGNGLAPGASNGAALKHGVNESDCRSNGIITFLKLHRFYMSTRNSYLIAAGIVSLAALLLLPSFAARAAAASLLLLGGIVFVVRVMLSQTSNEELQERDVHADQANDESPTGIFALGKLFEATMSGMREGLLVVDKDMRVVASNAAAHSLFNLSRGKLESQRLTELTRNPAIYDAFLDALKGTERSGVKVETHGPERLVFDLRVVPLAGSNGKVADGGKGAQGALGVFIDITRIERLEHVRQEFLSNVSHELRTPLTAILAFVETLETGAIDDWESSRRFLSIIRKNAFRMNNLIDDILELSAIEAGNVQVRAEEVELYPIVNDVISSLTTKSSGEGIAINNAVDREAMVYADARRLEQMLTNLVDNAIKFNRENGKVTIKFESGARGDEQRGSAPETRTRGSSPRVSKSVVTQALQSETARRDKIIVEDTGEGIPAQHLERLFERFYRVDRARSRDMGGTGLGLAIVKHLARAHGGEVTVTSELGKGSTFTIELPCL
jgi:two-component system, OmpR family, phosphate regulon sensor histidine kinase PhoR